MATTYLEVVNRVLRRLREATVTTIASTEYSRLVADFVSDIHQDVVAQYDWTSLRHTIHVNIAAGNSTYYLGANTANGGHAATTDRLTTTESMLLRDNCGRPQVWLYDNSSTDTTGIQLFELSDADIQTQIKSDTSLTQADPLYFSLRQEEDTDLGGLTLTIWPTPTTTRYMELRFWTPEATLARFSSGDSYTGIDNSTDPIIVPWRPIYLGALALALNERGEELGEPGNVAEARYLMALSAAIESDMNYRQRNNEYEFTQG